jgi:hypothetical protein
MHLIDKISKNCGLETSSPFVMEELFPLPFDKYILLHMDIDPIRNYSYYQDVVDIIIPTLNKYNIKVIQIGDQNCERLDSTIILLGELSVGQISYLIKNSMLVISTSEFIAQLVGRYDKNFVQLFSDTDSCYSGKYFGSKDNYRKIKVGNKCTFGLAESELSINKILPTRICDEVLDLLNIENTFPFKEVRVGKKYINKAVEMIPDSTVNIERLRIDAIVVRMDLKHDETILEKQLEVGICCIVTKDPINLNLLEKYRTRVREIAIRVDSCEDQFVKDCFELGFRVILVSSLSGDDLKKMKLKYIDYGPIFEDKNETEETYDKKELFFKTKKLTFSSGKLYLSEQHYLDSDPSSLAKEIKPVKRTEKFWKDLEHYTLYERIRNQKD